MPDSVAGTVEQQLRQERDRFLAFAFCGNDMLLEIDAEGRIRFAAGATELMAGDTSGKLIGRPFIDLVAPGDRVGVGALVAAATQAGKRFDDAPFILAPIGREAVKVEATGFSLPQLKGHCFLAVRRPRNLRVAAAEPARQAPAAEDILAARRTIDARDFDVAFQPVVSLDTGAYHHMEALLRLKGGMGAGPFVRLAENGGLIVDLDLAVAEVTVSRLLEVADKGRPLSIAVNLSGRSIESAGFFQRLCKVFSVRRALSQLMILEITDCDAITNLDLVGAFVRNMRLEGYRITLDDFGARGPAFELLRRIEVDYVKIDGRFIAESRKDERTKALVVAMTGMCRALGVTAIAEQVEDPETIDFLRECGVGYGQGYLFGKPMVDPDLLLGESMKNMRWRRSGLEVASYTSGVRGG
jgi:EAL domain-containing protein (putative c-di-GMP-specific phosphodiesterase class I)